MDRERLPTKEQINCIDDVQALRDIQDEIEKRMSRISTDLEFRNGTDEWEGRAISALAFHRYLSGAVNKRIKALGQGEPTHKADDAPQRIREDCSDLTWRLMDGEFDHLAEAKDEELDSAIQTLQEALDEAERDRADEIGRPVPKQDQAWLAESKIALRDGRAIRHQLTLRKAAIARSEKEAARLALEATRERIFIQACRDVLPKQTYQLLWDRVDRVMMEEADQAAA